MHSLSTKNDSILWSLLCMCSNNTAFCLLAVIFRVPLPTPLFDLPESVFLHELQCPSKIYCCKLSDPAHSHPITCRYLSWACEFLLLSFGVFPFPPFFLFISQKQFENCFDWKKFSNTDFITSPNQWCVMCTFHGFSGPHQSIGVHFGLCLNFDSI